MFVDDLTFSTADALSRTTHREIQAILNKHGMTIHWDKIRYCPAGQPKTITGCAVTSKGELDAPSVLRKKAMTALRWFRSVPSMESGNRALGLINAVRAIVPTEFNQERTALKTSLRGLRRRGPPH